jgi:1-acyl-sn-glycerol-3-phosphate acyltransferase/nucleoside-diphosphate-sugar epimerase
MENTAVGLIARSFDEHSAALISTESVAVVIGDVRLGEVIVENLSLDDAVSTCKSARPGSVSHLEGVTAAVYAPSLIKRSLTPDLSEAREVLATCSLRKLNSFVLISSAAIYGASFRNPGLIPESSPLPHAAAKIANQWLELESMVSSNLDSRPNFAILRCATVLSKDSGNALAQWFVGRSAVVLPGHDPSLQFLSPLDLAQAIACALRTHARGVFNVAPDGVIPARAALRLAGVKRIPVPRTLLRMTHGLSRTPAPLDYARYSWTVSNNKIKKHLGFQPKKSSAEAVAELRRSVRPQSDHGTRDATTSPIDDFGLDRAYIASYARTLFRFLADWYWRIEVSGLDYVPRQGRAVLAGMHRGFMPWDGVMALHLIVKNTGRYPRFLIHPGLVKFPFLANFMTKLGGIIACQENAAYVLERDELLGIFPEGIRGAFVQYSQAYQIQAFNRDAFVKIALRHRAPIIPFITVGSAEIFPILGKLQSRLWTRYSEWPSFPLTPTFPLLPLPLPSKWHTRFLPPVHVENEYPPSAAGNASIVRAISREVRDRMQRAVDEMLQRRRSIFFGSIFTEESQ